MTPQQKKARYNAIKEICEKRREQQDEYINDDQLDFNDLQDSESYENDDVSFELSDY